MPGSCLLIPGPSQAAEPALNALDVQTFLKMEKPSLRDSGFFIIVIIVVREQMSLPHYSQGSLQVLKSSANMSPIRETE